MNKFFFVLFLFLISIVAYGCGNQQGPVNPLSGIEESDADVVEEEDEAVLDDTSARELDNSEEIVQRASNTPTETSDVNLDALDVDVVESVDEENVDLGE